MRILHITNGYPNSKYPTYCIFIKEQIDSINKKKFKNDIFVINPKKNSVIGYFFGFIRMIFYMINNKSYDIYHCHHILSAFLLILANPFKKRKIVLAFLSDKQTEIDNLPFPTFFNKFIYNITFKKVNDFIIKNDKSIKIPSKNVHYIPNGVNMMSFQPLNKKKSRDYLNLPRDKTLILFVSAISVRKEKRYDRFMETLKILKEKYHINTKEVLMIDEKREDIPLFYNACDLHLLSSDYEGSPNSVKEAMCCNMKIVSTNVGNVNELFDGVSNCSVVDSFDANVIAEKCYQLLKGKEKPNSREKIIDLKLDINSVASKLIDIYEVIAEHK